MAFSHFSDPDRDGTDRALPDEHTRRRLAVLQEQHAAALAEWFSVSNAARGARSEREQAATAAQIAALEAQLADLEQRITEAEQAASRGHGALD